jgi:hypothetical protein
MQKPFKILVFLAMSCVGLLEAQPGPLFSVTIHPSFKRPERRTDEGLAISFHSEDLAGRAIKLGAPEIADNKFSEGIISNFFAATRREDLPAILELWHAEDRSSIEQKSKDPQFLARNKQHVLSIRELRGIRVIRYGAYRLVIVAKVFLDKSVSHFVFPMVEERGRLWMTNALNNDPVYAFVYASIAKSLTDDLIRLQPSLIK